MNANETKAIAEVELKKEGWLKAVKKARKEGKIYDEVTILEVQIKGVNSYEGYLSYHCRKFFEAQGYSVGSIKDNNDLRMYIRFFS